MSTYPDALRRLQIIYNECAQDAKASSKTSGNPADEFTRLKKAIHKDSKQVRQVSTNYLYLQK